MRHTIKFLIDGHVSTQDVDFSALGAATDLPDDTDRYFLPEAGAMLVPVEKLILTRTRPTGVANAGRLMLAAFKGEQPRRKPIALKRHGEDAFLVEDGNSTVVNAIASNWRAISGALT